LAEIPLLNDMVIVAQEDWDEVWRRNQFLIAGLARRCPATKFLFVELPCDLTYGLRSRQIFQRGSAVRRKFAQMGAGLRRVPAYPNIYTLVPPKLLPAALPAGDSGNRAAQALYIRRALRRLGIVRPVVWTQDPLAGPLLAHLPAALVIYDVTDDWTVVRSFSPGYRARIGAGDAQLTRRADVVLTCSDYLHRKKAAVHPATYLVPNGVDGHHYAAIDSGGLAAPALLTGFPRPLLGYIGTLHDERLDVDLIEALAGRFPNTTLVFVGPDHLTTETRRRFARHANIRRLGPVPYSEVPAYLQAFAICILPHRVTPFTESLNPIKAFEYLMSRRPVVSTAVAGLRELGAVVTVAQDSAEFLAAVAQRLECAPAYDADPALRVAAQNGWPARVDQLISILEPLCHP
jgi:glycosyltransferase involved in cell wall biosynthesis